MATGMSAEAELGNINSRLDKLDKDFQEMKKNADATTAAIDNMGDALVNMGAKSSSLNSITKIFNDFQTKAQQSMSNTKNEFMSSLNDIVNYFKRLPDAMRSDVKFIDINALKTQKGEAVRELDDLRRRWREAGEKMASTGIESKGSYNAWYQSQRQTLESSINILKANERINKSQKNQLQNLEAALNILNEEYNGTIKIYNEEGKKQRIYSTQINEKKKEVDLINTQIAAAEKYNSTIVQTASYYEPVSARIREITAQLQEMEKVRAVSGGDMTPTNQQRYAELEKERQSLEQIVGVMSACDKYIKGQITQEQLLANLQNEKNSLLGRQEILENQILDKQIKQAQKDREQAEKQRQKDREQAEKQRQKESALREEEETRKRIASIKYTNVSQINVAGIRDMINKYRELKSQMQEMEKQGDGNSKKFRQMSQEANAYKNKLSEAGFVMDNMNAKSGRLRNTLSSLASSFGIMFNVYGAVRFLKTVVSITGEFELQEKALAAIIKNQQKANDMFNKLQIMATKSPYNIGQLLAYNRQLAAYRVETEKLLPTMKMLGDVAAGVGVDMQRLILAYGQVKAANYLRGQELRQFSESGINILGELADKFTEVEGKAVSTGEVFERVSKRMVTFEDVNEVFERLTEKGGIFYEMQQQQAETLRGQIKNLSDAFKIEANKIGSSVSDIVKGVVQMIKTLMKNLTTIINVIEKIVIGFAAYKAAVFASTIAQMKYDASIKKSIIENSKFLMSLKKIREELFKMQVMGGSGGIWGAFKGGGWAALATVAVAAFVKWRNAVNELNKELSEVEQRNVEMYKTLKSEQFFGIRKSGVNKGLGWLDMYNNIDKLSDKFEYVDHMLEKLRERGIDISYDFNENTEHAVTLLDEFAERLEKSAELYSNITKKAELLRTYNDAFWGGYQGLFDQDSTKDIQQLSNSYVKIETLYAKEMDNYISRIEMLRGKLSELGIDMTESAQHYLEMLYDIHNLENQNATTKRKQLDLVRLINNQYNFLWKKDQLNITYDYLSQFNEVYREFMKTYSVMEEDLMKGIEKGSNEHLKRIKHLITSAFNDLPEDIQKEVFDKLLSEEYHMNIIVDAEWGIGKVEEKWDERQAFLEKLKDEIQFEEIKKAGKDTQEAFGALSEGVLNVVKATHDTIVNTIPSIKESTSAILEGMIPSHQQTKQVESEWMKLNISDIIQVDSKKSNEELRKAAKDRRDEIKNIIDMISKGNARIEAIQADIKYILPNIMLPMQMEGEPLEDYKKRLQDILQTAYNITNEFYKSIGGLDKETGRAKDYKSEFNSMIQFIRKLNTETEKLNKTFDAKIDTDKYKSALTQVRESYQGEFESLPKEFQSLFTDLMTNVDFLDKNAVINQLDKLKKLAASGKYKKDYQELIRLIEKAMGEEQVDVDVKLKIKEDESLYRQIDELFGDYEVTVELQNLGVTEDMAKSLFNLNYVDLSVLQHKLFSLQDQFTGKDAEKKYAEYIKKVLDMTDKANLEAVKKYTKYLQYEMSERVRIEMEYRKKMAEVYETPAFKGGDDGSQKLIIENLTKEMNKELSKVDWDELKTTDFFIEMFENLEHTSTASLNVMMAKLNQLKNSMSSLDIKEIKEVAKQMEQIENEMIRRNPFKTLISSIKEFRDEMKSIKEDEKVKSVLQTAFGTDKDIEIKARNLSESIAEVEKMLYTGMADGTKSLTEQMREAEAQWHELEKIKTGKSMATKDLAKVVLLGVTGDTNLDGFENVKKKLESVKAAAKSAAETLNKMLESTGLSKQEAIAGYPAIAAVSEYLVTLNELVKILGDLRASYEKAGDVSVLSADYAKSKYEDLKKQVDTTKKSLDQLISAEKNTKAAVKSIQEITKAFGEINEQSKKSFNSIMDNLEYFGAETDGLTETWKEFGNSIFDTVSSILTMIPILVTAFSAAGEAITAATGIIGLIAEAIQLTIALVKALAMVHDNQLQADIDRYKKKIDELTKSYERYENAFESAWDYERLRHFYDMTEELAEQQIDYYNKMIAAESDKKKKDQEQIDEWQQSIEDAQESILKKRAEIINELGGLGAEEDMKSATQDFVDAWFDAFMETGDGLSGLEENFDNFMNNIVKKQLMLRFSDAFFRPLYEQINQVVGDGEVTGQDISDLMSIAQSTFAGFNEQARAFMEGLGQFTFGDSLSGIQQGIQGITEDTAEIIAAYLNSIRFFVSDNNQRLQNVMNMLSVDNVTNPLVYNLRIIAQQTTDIRNLIDSVIAPNHGLDGGRGIKVFMD